MSTPSPPAPRGPTEGVFQVLLFAILLLAAAVRAPFWLGESVIGDEVFTHDVVALPTLDALAVVIEDVVHPPLHSLVLQGWAAVAGGSVHELRAFSFAMGLLTVLLAAWVGREVLGSKGFGLVAALMVALNDSQAFHGHAARAYSMYAALVLLLLWALIRCVRLGADGWRWLAFAVCALGVVYTHYVGWLFLFTAVGGAWAVGKRRDAWRLSWAVVGVGVLFIPWALAVWGALQRKGGLGPNLGWVDTPSWIHPLWMLGYMTGVPLGRLGTLAGMGIAAVLVAVLLLGMVRRRTESLEVSPRLLAPLLLAASLPPVLLCLLAQPPIQLPIWGTRHLLPAQGPWAIVLAGGLLLLWTRRPAVAWAAGALLVALQSFAAFEGLRATRVVPYADAARYLSAERAADEPLFAASPHSLGLPIGYHMELEDAIGALPEGNDLPRRLWLAYRPGQAAEAERAQALLAADYRSERERDFGRRASDPNGTRVALFVRTDGER